MHNLFTFFGLREGGVQTPHYLAAVVIAVADADRLHTLSLCDFIVSKMLAECRMTP